MNYYIMAEMDEIRKDAETYAAIDIGSNAVRLLIKQLESDIKPVFSKALLLRVPLRLGFDVFAEGRISPKKEKDMVRLMKCYRHLMKIYGVDDYRACATSAMRDAANGPEIIRAAQDAAFDGAKVVVTDNIGEAISGADAVYTDVFFSMGQTKDPVKEAALMPMQVNAAMMAKANPGAIFLHCLPAHRGEEVTDEVLEGAYSRIFPEAENRLHAQKAVMYLLMKD